MKQNRNMIQKFIDRNFKCPTIRFITVIPKNAFAYMSPLAQYGACPTDSTDRSCDNCQKQDVCGRHSYLLYNTDPISFDEVMEKDRDCCIPYVQ